MTATAPAPARAALAGTGPLGLLGGTFDPVHAGHLALARGAQAALGLEAVRFIPVGDPWQKAAAGVTAAALRARMLALALAGHDGWSVDACEIERPGPSYTVETLAALRAQVGPERPLVWILGFDQFQRLPTWHRWRDIPALAHLAFAQRSGSDSTLDATMAGFARAHSLPASGLRTMAAGGVLEFPMEPVACSASQIRQALQAGDSAAGRRYLAPAVFEFVQSHHLYGSHGH